jgi:S1-C subfamily serine protease
MELPMLNVSSPIAGSLVSALALCTALGAAAPASATITDNPFLTVTPRPLQAAPLMQPNEVYRMAWASIARVSVTYQVKGKTQGAAGTSFLIDDHGDLATNCHVVSAEDASGPVKVEVQFPDDQTWRPAKVLGCDAPGDIAVIHVDGLSPDRRPLHFAEPSTFGPGEDVIAIGYGLDLDGDPSVSRGIISALHRSLGGHGDLVQTDAVINHGNSGGPLLDMHGDVVGVNSYGEVSTVNVSDIAHAQTQNSLDAGPPSTIDVNVVQGVNYAIGATTAKLFVQEIIATGHVTRLDLGITVVSINPEAVYLPRDGVLIKAVTPGSAAAGAGITAGMVLYAIDVGNGVTWQIRTEGDFRDALALVAPGRTVKLHYFALTDKGMADIKNGNSVPVSDANWYYADVMPNSSATSLIAAN